MREKRRRLTCGDEECGLAPKLPRLLWGMLLAALPGLGGRDRVEVVLGILGQGDAGSDDAREQRPKRVELGLVPPDGELGHAHD